MARLWSAGIPGGKLLTWQSIRLGEDGTGSRCDAQIELDANGTARLRKFGCCGERTTNAEFSVTMENKGDKRP